MHDRVVTNLIIGEIEFFYVFVEALQNAVTALLRKAIVAEIDPLHGLRDLKTLPICRCNIIINHVVLDVDLFFFALILNEPIWYRDKIFIFTLLQELGLRLDDVLITLYTSLEILEILIVIRHSIHSDSLRIVESFLLAEMGTEGLNDIISCSCGFILPICLSTLMSGFIIPLARNLG